MYTMYYINVLYSLHDFLMILFHFGLLVTVFGDIYFQLDF